MWFLSTLCRMFASKPKLVGWASRPEPSAPPLTIICIDATHGMGNGYKLITVLTVNEFYQGTPLAFCVSKKETANVLLTFFEAIKVRIGKPLLSKNFMSDDAGWYYDSWQLVMDPENRFDIKPWRCSWHINRALKRNLNKHVSGGQDNRDKIMKDLYKLRYEPDESFFLSNLEKFRKEYAKNVLYSSFCAYLEENYFGRAQIWAFAYKGNTCITTNMHLESFHKTFKHSYLKKRANLRVDHTLEMLLKYLDDKEHAYETDKLFGVNLKQNAFVLKMHKEAEKEMKEWTILDCELQEEDKLVNAYIIFRNQSIYVLKPLKMMTDDFDCPGQFCPFKCSFCKICVHLVSCSCEHYRVRHLVCKHLHLLKIHLSNQTQPQVFQTSEQKTKAQLQNLFDEIEDIRVNTFNEYDESTPWLSGCCDDQEIRIESENIPTENQSQILNQDRTKILWNQFRDLSNELFAQSLNFEHNCPSESALEDIVKSMKNLSLKYASYAQGNLNAIEPLTPKKRNQKRHATPQKRFNPQKNSKKKQKRLF